MLTIQKGNVPDMTNMKSIDLDQHVAPEGYLFVRGELQKTIDETQILTLPVLRGSLFSNPASMTN
jgi:hypothetical protein